MTFVVEKVSLKNLNVTVCSLFVTVFMKCFTERSEAKLMKLIETRVIVYYCGLRSNLRDTGKFERKCVNVECEFQLVSSQNHLVFFRPRPPS